MPRGCCPHTHRWLQLIDGFFVRGLAYLDDDTRMRMNDFWLRIINAGGDEPTEESRRLRRRLLVEAGKHDPRDGGPDEEPLE